MTSHVVSLTPKPPPAISTMRRTARRVLREALMGVGEGTIARRRLEDALVGALRARVLDEREACARVCDAFAWKRQDDDVAAGARWAAELIRARKDVGGEP